MAKPINAQITESNNSRSLPSLPQIIANPIPKVNKKNPAIKVPFIYLHKYMRGGRAFLSFSSYFNGEF